MSEPEFDKAEKEAVGEGARGPEAEGGGGGGLNPAVPGPPPLPGGGAGTVAPLEVIPLAGVALPYADRSTLGYASLYTEVSTPSRMGDLVVAVGGMHLGPNCPICNAPGVHETSKLFSWHPQWMIVLFVPACLLSCIGLLIVVIVLLVVTKRARVRFGLCKRHARMRARLFVLSGLFALLAGVGAIVGFVYSVTGRRQDQEWGFVGFVGCVLFVIGWAVCARLMLRLRVVKIEKNIVRLKGACPAFLDTLPAIYLPR